MGFLSFIPLIGQLIDKVFPNTIESDKAKLELMKQIQSGEIEEIKGKFGVIATEGASEHWLVAAWRPITMLVFLAMIVSWWFGYVPVNLSDALLIELFSLIKIGLGGYVVGRSMEKTVGVWKGIRK